MKAYLRCTPFDDALAELEIEERCSVSQLLDRVSAPEWFRKYGVVKLDDQEIPYEEWRHKRFDPGAEGCIELCYAPKNTKTALLLASVALIVATGFIGAGGIATAFGLGATSTFAAGGIGASLAAAGVGIGGAMLLGALTAVPNVGGPGKEKELAQAGITGNPLSPDQLLHVILGKIGFSPPLLAPFYTVFDSDNQTVKAMFGVQGRCLIENIRINGTPIEQLEGIEWETREGGPADLPLTLAQDTNIQQTNQVTLSNFSALQENSKNDQLIDQVTPANSSPDWHYLKTDGTADEIWLRFLYPSGTVRTDVDEQAGMPIRIEIRKVGDVSWRALPTMHVFDIRKGKGPLRIEAKLKFQTQPSGRHFSNATGEYPVFELSNLTGIGQSFEYQADAYFQNATTDIVGVLPVMTAATTSGVTMSASSTNGADSAWKAADFNAIANYWRPSNNSLPAWLKVDLGSAQIIRSYAIWSNYSSDTAAPTTAPTKWYVEGSNDDTNWTVLDSPTVDVSALPLPIGVYQIGTPGSYRYYRINFTANNGAANQELRIGHLTMMTHDAFGIAIGADTSTAYGHYCRHNSGSDTRCVYGSLDKNGATFYLDPAQWLPGTYEVRVKRGVAFDNSSFSATSYSYSGNAASSDFFDYRTVSGVYTIRVGQKNYRSDCQMEVFSTVSYDVPVDTTGIACIAIEMKNTVIKSVYAEFTSYAPIWSGGVWTETEVPTKNPAALYRKLLLGWANANPIPGEILELDVFEDWYETCEAQGYECNAVVNGITIRDAKQMLGACGWAAPRDSNEIGILEDKDTSALPARNPFTPANGRNLGTEVVLPDLPHAVRAKFFDETDLYAEKEAVVYRDNYTIETATKYETRPMPGFTNETKVIARTTFDFRQLQLRAKKYIWELGPEGMNIPRGRVVTITDNILKPTQAAGWIKSIQTVGPNIVSITLNNVMPWGRAQDDSAAVDDVTDLTDVLDTSVPMGIFIRVADGSMLLKEVSDVSDSNVCTFVTPFASSGSGVAVDQMVGAGVWGEGVARRVKVMARRPRGRELWRFELADEAPELFA